MSYIRPAILEDATDICELYEEVAAYYELEPSDLDSVLVELGIQDSKVDNLRVVYVLIDDDLESLIGMITAHEEDNFYGQVQFWIDGFFVRPDKIGGWKLVREVEKAAKARGVDKIIFNIKPEFLDYFNRKGYSGIDIVVEKWVKAEEL